MQHLGIVKGNLLVIPGNRRGALELGECPCEICQVGW